MSCSLTGIVSAFRVLLLITAAAVWAAVWTARPVTAQQLDAPMEVVEFGEADTLRGVVEHYLLDPDLWPVVLALNGIVSPAQVVPGVQLRLPVQQVRAADVALRSSLDAIQEANAEGAQIFAPVEIGQAIESRENAVLSRESGIWAEVVQLSDIATGFAHEALAISAEQRDRAAEAVVSDVQGSVEGRAPAEPAWSNRTLNDVLVEFERMRTLSDSTTQITFRDLSRLRLNANSNATIQRMRSDPLTGGEVTKVSLANGDFYALLNQLSDNTSFEIDVPGVKTTTDSTDFWIKNDQKGARFVNYDGPELEIQQGGEKLMLGENEGVVLTGQGAQRADVLGGVTLSLPDQEAIAYAGQVDLIWNPVKDANGYWLEVARDPGFNQMEVSEWSVPETQFAARDLIPGEYHWRVAAIDLLGLPGEWSRPRLFTMRIDETPPFLTLLSPAAGSLTSVAETEILGATEPEASLAINGVAVTAGADGSFLTVLPLLRGANSIQVLAIDPAGNRTTRSLSVIYRPATQVEISFSDEIPLVDGAFASRSDQLSVWGQTNASAGAEAVIRDANGAEVVRGRVDANGELRFSVPASTTVASYEVEILAPTGAIEGTASFRALSDRVAPEMDLDLPPPQVTGETELMLEGSAGDAVLLTLNEKVVALSEGRFAVEEPLNPGENSFELVAEDATGNVRVLRFDTFLDVEAPKIQNIEMLRPDGEDGPIEIRVAATDAGGLRQAASYVVRIGDVEREGFLRCNATQNLCSATLPAEPGALEMIELMVEDYAGNAAFE